MHTKEGVALGQTVFPLLPPQMIHLAPVLQTSKGQHMRNKAMKPEASAKCQMVAAKENGTHETSICVNKTIFEPKEDAKQSQKTADPKPTRTCDTEDFLALLLSPVVLLLFDFHHLFVETRAVASSVVRLALGAFGWWGHGVI